MAYTLSVSVDAGTAGLTLKAAFAAAGTIHASLRDITTGMTDYGQGFYEFVTASAPDGYRGAIFFYTGTVGAGSDFSGVVIYGVASVNPQEIEIANANITQISGDATAADNAESFFDGTGYAGINNTIPQVNNVTTVVTTNSCSALADGSITALTIATGAIDADALATDALNAIVDLTWDEPIAGHLGVGSTGEALNAASSAGDPWSTALPGAYGAGSAGFIIGTNLDAQLSNVEADTQDLQSRTPTALVAGRMDASVGAMAANVLTATAIANDAITDAKVAADVTIASVTGTVGSVTGAVGSVTGNVGGNVVGDLQGTLTATERNAIADALLKRDWTAVAGEAARSTLNALRFLRNKWSMAGATLTVTKEDDVTTAWDAAVTTNAAADPVTGSDPN